MVGWSSCDQNCMAHKAETMYYLALWLTLNLEWKRQGLGMWTIKAEHGYWASKRNWKILEGVEVRRKPMRMEYHRSPRRWLFKREEGWSSGANVKIEWWSRTENLFKNGDHTFILTLIWPGSWLSLTAAQGQVQRKQSFIFQLEEWWGQCKRF